MTASAKFKYVRISQQKVRSVVNLVRGKSVPGAIDTLNFCPRKASGVVAKAIRSALANAASKGSVDVDALYVSKISVGQGPTLKRYRAKARGMAGAISKRTSHIFVELKEK